MENLGESKTFSENIAAELTPKSLEVFVRYAEDAVNWSGSPWVTAGNVSITKAERGNLSDLVQKSLIVVVDYEGDGRSEDMYIKFTERGQALAAQLNINLGMI